MRYYVLYLRNTLLLCKRNFSQYPKQNVTACIRHFKNQYNISDIKYLKSNSDIYDKFMPFIMTFPRFGLFVVQWMYKITHIKSVLIKKLLMKG